MNIDRRLMRELRAVRTALALTIGFGMLAGLALVAQAHYLSRTVTRAFLDGRGLAELWPLLAALGAVIGVRAVLLWAQTVSAHHVAARVKLDLRERLLAHLLALGPTYARAERSGELANTATEGIEALEAYLSEYIPQLALSVMIPLAMLAVIFPLDTLSGVVLLLTAPLIPFFMVLIGKAASAQSQRQWTQLSRMSAHFLDALQGLSTLKIFGRSRDEIATIAQISDRFRLATMSVLRIAFLSALVLEMLATLSTAVVAVEIGLRLLYGRLSFEQAFFVLILAPEYYLPLRALGARFHAGTSGVTAAQRIYAVLESAPPPRPQIAEPPPAPPYTVRFERVSYAYDAGERPALYGVSFTLGAGETIALVGASGAGKSTLADLLLGFLLPTDGRITVNGRDLRTLDVAAWRERIAWVPQRPYLFAGSVAENIRLGAPSAPLADVARAAEQAGAADFIRALPQGYETPLGERGARLSGGQAQRIALARAFLRDAPLLVLDEATANLDPQTEAALQASIEALLRGRTALVIAHRLRTVQRATRIVVLAGGRVAEIGTHAELLARGGLYARLAADENRHA